MGRAAKPLWPESVRNQGLRFYSRHVASNTVIFPYSSLRGHPRYWLVRNLKVLSSGINQTIPQMLADSLSTINERHGGGQLKLQTP